MRRIKHRKVWGIFLSIILLLTSFNFDYKYSEASVVLTSSQIVSYFNGKVGTKYASGKCLAFVADSFQNLGAPRSSTCCAYAYGKSRIKGTSMTNIKIGADVFFTGSGSTCRNGHRCGHIGVYVGDGYCVHAMGGKVQRTKVSTIDAYSNLTYFGWGIHDGIIIKDDPVVRHIPDSSYTTPIQAVPLTRSGNIATYDTFYNKEANRYISAGDECSILEVYTDGWCKVEYPSGSSRRQAFVKKNVFFASENIIKSGWSPSAKTNSYKYSDLSGSFGTVFTSDSCTEVYEVNF